MTDNRQPADAESDPSREPTLIDLSRPLGSVQDWASAHTRFASPHTDEAQQETTR